MPTDLWNFAITLYARPDAESACLQLQASGANVCLLLTALWLESRQVPYSATRGAALQALAGPWHEEVIKPLRQLRQDWRTEAQHNQQLGLLREQVKALELQAEKALLARLEHCSKDWSGGKAGSWLDNLAGAASRDNRDALESLRIAAVTV